nr:transposase [Burkholderia pseudomallei]
MGARARFHPYSAWRKPENKFRQLCAADAASQNKLARSIHAVHLEDILRKIDGKKSNGVHDDTPMNGNARSHDTPAGAVHTINWKAKFGGMTVSEAQRLKELEQENSKLKRLLAESMLDNAALKDLLARK